MKLIPRAIDPLVRQRLETQPAAVLLAWSRPEPEAEQEALSLRPAGQAAHRRWAALLGAQESGGVVVRWHTASLAEVNEICNAGMPAKHRKSVWGCYRRTFDQCTIYTASPDSRTRRTSSRQRRRVPRVA